MAVVFAILLPLRASTWLASLNSVAACAALVGLAAAAQPDDVRFSVSALVSLTKRILAGVFGPSILARSLRPADPGNLARLAPYARGAAIASLPVALLGGLVASADIVFAEAITPDVDPMSSIGHTLLSLLVACGLVGLIAIAHSDNPAETLDARPLGPIEALVVLGATAALFGAFALVQLLSAVGGSDKILAEQGVSFADYARGGFFQLLWVAGLTAVLLGAIRLVVREASPSANRCLRAGGAVVALLTCIIVAVAIVRLGLYTDEFGQTTLRWYCTAFAWMLGIAFVFIAFGHVSRFGRWLPTTLLSLTALTLIAVNLLNPEARVAEHNVSRSGVPDSLDAEYLIRLSADAWPVLADHQALVDSTSSTPRFGDDAFASACERAARSRGYGIFGFNLAVRRLDC